MSVLTWEDVDYETGIDRGVLYLNDTGYVWNGLINVEEDPNAGDVKSLFLDGVNYLNVLTGRFYSATVTAFSVPKPFLECLGQKPVVPGFRMTRQPRARFNFAYRVLKANGYHLHLVYNCLAIANDRDNQTIADNTEPLEASWVFNATPVVVANVYKPTSHFVIDSERADPEVLNDLENFLYGTPSTSPDFPTIAELLAYFGDFG